MKLDLPAVDRLVDSLENAHERPVPVMAHRVALVTDTWLLFALTLIGVGLCAIGAALLEGGKHGGKR